MIIACNTALPWQQRVVYHIDVKLNTIDHTLSGTEHITYLNNSPDSLGEIWLNVYPNAYKDRNSVWARESEQMKEFGFSLAQENDRGYLDIRSLQIDEESPRYEIDDTRMRVILEKSLMPGDSVTFRVDFFLKIPKIFSRLGYKDNHYEIVQWYPKICVYDRAGWHNEYYHNIGEFYGEFGDFDVQVTLPSGFIVGATGDLVEPAEEIAFLDSFAIKGSELDRLRSGNKIVRKPRSRAGVKTLRFIARDVHDFAWVADKNYRLIRETYDSTVINVFHLKNEKEWCFAADYAKDAVKYYGQWYGPYPYKNLTVCRGYFSGGMEYPNLVIIGTKGSRLTRTLEQVVMHEVGHQWFYGLVGSDEMNEAWLDEGMNTFSEIRYMETKYGTADSYFKSAFLPRLTHRQYQKLFYYVTAVNKSEKPILTKSADFANEPQPVGYLTAAYSKPAFVLDMLKHMIGEVPFNRTMHRYYEEYKYRHPSTSDFIEIAREESQQDLTPFFDAWLRTTDVCDYAIKKVYRQADGTGVIIQKKGKITMPVEVMLETKQHVPYLRQINGDSSLMTIFFPVPGSMSARLSLTRARRFLKSTATIIIHLTAFRSNR